MQWEPMCQMVFYNQLPTSDTIHKCTGPPEVGRIHIGALTDVEPGHRWTPSVRTWNRCVKSCFIINCQLLIQFTSGPWLQKWAGSTSVTPLMWNLDTGAYTKSPAMETMCQIMFYNQFPTSDTIHKWTLATEVGLFHIGEGTDVESGHWGRHQVSSH